MIWPHWLWIGTPAKFWIWLSNRAATGLGSFVLWKRNRSARSARRLWAQILLLNLVSWGALILIFLWLRGRV